MIRYELIKVLSKKMNKAIIFLGIIISIVFSFFASTSNVYVDSNGIEQSGVFSTRKLSAEKNAYKGELTNEVLEKIIIDNKKISKEYPTSIPNDVYAERIQPGLDIQEMINHIIKGDGEYDSYAILSLNVNAL